MCFFKIRFCIHRCDRKSSKLCKKLKISPLTKNTFVSRCKTRDNFFLPVVLISLSANLTPFAFLALPTRTYYCRDPYMSSCIIVMLATCSAIQQIVELVHLEIADFAKFPRSVVIQVHCTVSCKIKSQKYAKSSNIRTFAWISRFYFSTVKLHFLIPNS